MRKSSSPRSRRLPALDVVSKQRGEYVLVIGRRQLPPDEVDDDRLAAEMELEQASGASVREASESVARKLGVSRRLAYRGRTTDANRRLI